MKEAKTFNILFAAMGTCLLLVAGWIGNSVAHIPVIEQKLDDFMVVAKDELGDHKAQLHDHEGRIIKLEQAKNK